jgi:hypothetical protein
MIPARSLKQVNTAIKKAGLDAILCKSEGCFFVSSDNDEIGLYLSSLESTSIYVYQLNHQSVQDWVKDVSEIMKDPYTNQN